MASFHEKRVIRTLVLLQRMFLDPQAQAHAILSSRTTKKRAPFNWRLHYETPFELIKKGQKIITFSLL